MQLVRVRFPHDYTRTFVSVSTLGLASSRSNLDLADRWAGGGHFSHWPRYMELHAISRRRKASFDRAEVRLCDLVGKEWI